MARADRRRHVCRSGRLRRNRARTPCRCAADPQHHYGCTQPVRRRHERTYWKNAT